jgi:tetratricopeptide (TPR) repeat protein
LVLVELHKPQDAVGEFKKALELDPNVPKARSGLARAYIELRDWTSAQASINEALEKNASDADAYYCRGLLGAARGDFAAAAPDLEKAIQLDPSHAYAHYHAGIVYNRLKRPDMMARHFQAFLQLAPTAPEAGKVRDLLRAIR